MAKRLAGPRQGDLAEGFGVQLLRLVALVAEVPRQEDVGLDAVATLTERDGKLYYARDSFWVQFKKRPASGKPITVEWDLDKTKLMVNQRLPVLIGEVILEPLELRLFSLNSLDQPSTSLDEPEGTLTVAKIAGGMRFVAEDRKLPLPVPVSNQDAMDFHIGPPIVTIKPAYVGDQNELTRIFNVLSKWLSVENLNVQLRALQTKLYIHEWDESDGPKAATARIGTQAGLSVFRHELVRMVAPLERLRFVTTTALAGRNDPRPGAAVGLLTDWLAEEGITRDDVSELALRADRWYEVVQSMQGKVRITSGSPPPPSKT